MKGLLVKENVIKLIGLVAVTAITVGLTRKRDKHPSVPSSKLI